MVCLAWLQLGEAQRGGSPTHCLPSFYLSDWLRYLSHPLPLYWQQVSTDLVANKK